MRLAYSKLRSSVFNCVVKCCRLEVRKEVFFQRYCCIHSTADDTRACQQEEEDG